MANDDEDLIERRFRQGITLDSNEHDLRVGKDEDDYQISTKKHHHVDRPFSPPFTQMQNFDN